MKILLTDRQGRTVAEIDDEFFPVKAVIPTIWGSREYQIKLNYVREEGTRKLDKTKIKSANMFIE